MKAICVARYVSGIMVRLSPWSCRTAALVGVYDAHRGPMILVHETLVRERRPRRARRTCSPFPIVRVPRYDERDPVVEHDLAQGRSRLGLPGQEQRPIGVADLIPVRD